MRHISIADKLILVSMAIITGTILIVASYSFVNAKEAILERTFNQLTSIRAVKSMLIKDYFKSRFNEISLIKSSTDIQNLFRTINTFSPSSTYSEIKDSTIYFNNQLIQNISNRDYNRITFVGNNKRYLSQNYSTLNFSYDSIKIKHFWDRVLQNDSIFLEDLQHYPKSDQAYFTIYTNIRNSSDQIVGLVIYELDLSAINEIMLEKGSSNGLGKSGESYLVNSDSLMLTQSRFKKASVLKTKVNSDAVKLASINSYDTRIITDYRGIRVLSSFSRLNIQNHKWAIIAEIDYSEATVPIYQIGYEITFISIFIFVSVLLIVIILSRKITQPIIQLHKAATRIGEGIFDINIDYRLQDEIGDLGMAFEKMAQQLDTQNQELKTEKNKNLRSLIDGQETERERLSRELHDSLGQLLIALKLKYENCRNTEKLKTDSFNDLSLLFDKTIEETRRISNNLRPAALSEFGLITAIRHICNTITDSTDINIHFHTTGKFNQLNQEQQTYIFRIVQEALTNIVKHSQANSVHIKIESNQKIKILINDNGKGFDKTKINPLKSNGLNNIQNRVLLLSGILDIHSEINKGTSINISIPNP